MDAKNWIAISAASALGLGLVAAGAVSTAHALPLVAGTTNLPVSGITVTDDGLQGTGANIDFSVSSDSIMSPEPNSIVTPASPISPISPVSVVTPSPVTPPSPVTAPSPATPASPASIASPASVG